ncbi:MAG: DUF4919 domain-containing protein [Bacteroidales bacterium]|nr:DUF4919 domain-containing protein [Bacteroidales bacterium]
MKKIFSLVLFLAVFSSVFSQEISKLIITGDSLYDAGKYQEAADVYNLIFKINENSLVGLDKLSNCMVNLDKVDSAKTLLYKAIDINFKYAEAYASLSNIYFLEGEVDTSLTLIKLAQKYNPDTAIYVVFEGINYMYYESLDTALSMFEKALEIEPNNATAFYYISYVYFSADFLDSSLKYVNLAIAENDEDADYYKLRAEIYYSDYRFTDAMFEIDKALDIEPKNEDFVLAKAEIYSSLSQYRDVLRVILPFAKKEYDADFHYYTVIGYYNLGMIDSTMFYIHDAHENDPENDLFYYLEGYVYYLDGQYNNAMLAFNAAIQLKPDEAEYYYFVCNSKIRLNTDSSMLDLNEKFHDLNQDNMDKMNKFSRSKKNKYYYQKLLAKFNYDPTSLSLDEYFMFYYGSALQDDFSGYSNSNPAISQAFEEENYEYCIRIGKSFIEEHPTSIATYFYIANSYFMLGKADLSIKYLTIYYGLLQSIICTGNGETEETAFIVSSVTDEYTVMKFHEYSFAGQSLVSGKKHNYDVLYYMDRSAKRGMYFNIDLFFGKN